MTNPTPRLSIAIIVRNDAVPLAQTLQSIEAIADEIVVVDTGSSDNTRDVAKQFGGNVMDIEWSDDFSAARNHALACATGDWVLWLDAGETMSHDDATALKQQIAGDKLDPASAYVMIIQPPAAPGVIAAEQIACIRLHARREGVRFQGRVRESLHETLESLGVGIDGLPFRIRRGAREHDQATKRRRAQRNLRLADLEIAECGRSPQLLNTLAEAAQTLGDSPRAVDLYSECLETEQAASSERLEAYYGLLTSLDGTPGARSAQLSLCVKALEEYPLDAQLLCAMGGYLQADKRIDLAIRSYQTAYEYGRINPLVWHLDEITAIASVCHAAALQAQSNDDEALEVLQTAIGREGHLPRLCRALLELHIKHGRSDVALQQVPYLLADDEAQSPLCEAVAGACLAAGGSWPEALLKLQAAHDAGCRDLICFRWLTIALLAVEAYEQANHLLGQWRATYPADPEPLRILQALGASERTVVPAMNRRVDRPQGAQHETPAMRIVQPNVLGATGEHG